MRDENQVYEELQVAESPEQREALERELISLLRGHAFAVCWGKLGQWRPDIVNYAVGKAMTHLDGFRGDSKLSTWFHTIVLNLCNSTLRVKRKHSQVRSVEEVSEEELGVSVDLDRGLEVQEILATLNVQELALVAALAEGLSGEALAQRLGVPRKTARTRLWRLRRKLKKQV